jgi:hypothetical protein
MMLGVQQPSPTNYLEMNMSDNCMFYSHRAMVAQGVVIAEQRLKERQMDCDDVVAFVLSGQAWHFARMPIAGNA